jgi:hypothetical protein
MTTEFKKEEKTCERCHKSNINSGTIAHYKKHGLNGLLCQDCIKEIEEYYSIRCSKCDKPSHMRGNLIEFENKKICTICMDEINMKK